jgi:hypothetical protein
LLYLPHADPPRDQWERPLIDGVAYTRASTLAKALDDQGSLIQWSARMAVTGLARSKDLIAAAAATDVDDKAALNRIVDRAKDRAQSMAKADIGTAIHAVTVMLDRGLPVDGQPDGVLTSALAYCRAVEAKRLRPLAAEVFVVCRELGAAGTFDRLLQGPTRTLIADLKTSANPAVVRYSALSWAVQLTVYAHGTPWLPGRGFVTWGELDLPEPDRDRGLVVHVPQGTSQTHLYSVDLRAGWEAAQLALDVRRWRNRRDLTTHIP